MENKPILIRITTVPISFTTLLKGQLRHIGKHYDVIAVSSNGEEVKTICKNEAVIVKTIPLTRKISPFTDLIALIRTCVFFKKTKPLIVHTHTPKAGLIGMLAARIMSVPIKMHTIAGLPLMEKKGILKSLLEQIERLTSYCADYVYPNSYELKKIVVREKYAQENKVKVIGNGSSNGIDINFFSNNQIDINQRKKLLYELNLNEDDFVYCFVGRIVEDKGINELIEAFENINKTYKHTKLLLIGPFENELNPINEKSLLAIQQNTSIIFVGFQNDVRPYLSISKVFVFPSYREGFPNGPLQAGAMGLPAIVTNINGCNEIIKHNYNGIIIQSKSVGELECSMKILLENNKLRNYLATNARENIVQRYDQQFLWNALLGEYQQLEKEYYSKKKKHAQ